MRRIVILDGVRVDEGELAKKVGRETFSSMTKEAERMRKKYEGIPNVTFDVKGHEILFRWV